MRLMVSLNGSNYVSEQTRQTFEQALRDGFRVERTPPSDNGNGHDHSGGNGHGGNGHHPAPLVTPAVGTAPPPDYLRLLESVERGLAHAYAHQHETLQVHERYLQNQSEYARIFARLMEQQHTLFSHAPQSDVTLTVAQSLARTIEQFHRHQEETLHVHHHFLRQQAAYARDFVQILRQQVNAVMGGNGHHRPQPAVEAPDDETWTADWDDDTDAAPTPTATLAPPSPPAPTAEPTPTAEVAPPPASPIPSPAPAPAADLTDAFLAIVAEKTGYPAEMLELTMDMEADLGIDSIKRVEILGALQDRYPDLPEVDADALAELRTLGDVVTYVSGQAPAPTATPAAETAPPSDLTDAFLAIVAEKTGYPAEMLELTMDMEADLGIDSIKRVEILGALQDRHPDLPEVDADALAELRTLGDVIAYVSQAAPAKKA